MEIGGGQADIGGREDIGDVEVGANLAFLFSSTELDSYLRTVN